VHNAGPEAVNDRQRSPDERAGAETGSVREARARRLVEIAAQAMGGAEAWAQTPLVRWRSGDDVVVSWWRAQRLVRFEGVDRLSSARYRGELDLTTGRTTVEVEGHPPLTEREADRWSHRLMQRFVHDSRLLFAPLLALEDERVSLAFAGTRASSRGPVDIVRIGWPTPGAGLLSVERAELAIDRRTGVPAWVGVLIDDDEVVDQVELFSHWRAFGAMRLPEDFGNGALVVIADE